MIFTEEKQRKDAIEKRRNIVVKSQDILLSKSLYGID